MAKKLITPYFSAALIEIMLVRTQAIKINKHNACNSKDKYNNNQDSAEILIHKEINAIAMIKENS